MASSEPVLPLKVSFNPIIRTYLLWYVSFFLFISIIGILFLPFWLLGIGQWWSGHYFNNLECELSDRSLRFKKGILVQVEKTIPLENIQDVTFVAGPILRHFDLCILKFETAGQSQRQANDMELIGIIDAQAFRTHIIEQRQRLMTIQPDSFVTSDTALLTDIRDTLSAIKHLLQNHLNQTNA
jgi:putative membrane protein